MPNNKRPVSLFKGQNKGVNSPKSGIQNVAMSPYNIHNGVTPHLCFKAECEMLYRQYKNRLFCSKCGRGGLVFDEGCVWTREESKGFFGGERNRGILASARKMYCAEW